MRRLLCWKLKLAPVYNLLERSPAGDGALGGRAGAGFGASDAVGIESEVERCEILLPREVRGDDHILTFRTQYSASGFLRRLATDSMCMRALRGVLSELPSSSASWRMSDGEVLDQLAWRLVAGTVRIAVRLVRRRSGGGPDETSTVARDIPPRSDQRSTPTVQRPVAESPAPAERDPLQEAVGCDCMKQASLEGCPLVLIDAP